MDRRGHHRVQRAHRLAEVVAVAHFDRLAGCRQQAARGIGHHHRIERRRHRDGLADDVEQIGADILPRPAMCPFQHRADLRRHMGQHHDAVVHGGVELVGGKLDDGVLLVLERVLQVPVRVIERAEYDARPQHGGQHRGDQRDARLQGGLDAGHADKRGQYRGRGRAGVENNAAHARPVPVSGVRQWRQPNTHHPFESAGGNGVDNRRAFLAGPLACVGGSTVRRWAGTV